MDTKEGGKSRWDIARDWLLVLFPALAEFDDDGATLALFDDKFEVFENTTIEKVAPIFRSAAPRNSTDTAGIIALRANDYLDQRLGKPASGWGPFKKAGVPANPKVKKRILLCFTDGKPDSQHALEEVIVGITQRMTAGGLTKDDLVITFVQVGSEPGAKNFLDTLNNGLESKGATMDIVGVITCEQACKMSTKQLLEAALDAE